MFKKNEVCGIINVMGLQYLHFSRKACIFVHSVVKCANWDATSLGICSIHVIV